MSRFLKSDIQMHSDGYRPRGPAINVKVHRWLDDLTAEEFLEITEGAMPEFNAKWIESNVASDKLDRYFNYACENGFEMACEDAKEFFGSHVKCYTEGRSGGWLVVKGLPDVESWDAIMVQRWGKFTRYCREGCDDIAYQQASMVYCNLPEIRGFAEDEEVFA